MADAWDSGTRAAVQRIPLLTVREGGETGATTFLFFFFFCATRGQPSPAKCSSSLDRL